MKSIALSDVQEGMVLAQEIYPSHDSTVPVLQRNTVLTRRIISRLPEFDITEVFVEEEEAAPSVEIPEEQPTLSREVQNRAMSGIVDMFSVAKKGMDGLTKSEALRVVKEIDSVTDELVNAVLYDVTALVNINSLKSYDEYTYHHSLSVAVLSIAIGHALGFSVPDMSLLGKSALMHDIGKTSIPIDIIQKTSRLSEEEFSIIKNHSSEGYRYLSGAGIGEEKLWRNVLFHHEKLDGTGYPLNLKGGDIPIMSRIICVADVYDALTSNRPYRSPMEPADAAEYIMGNVDSHFDYDIVKAFLKKLELYPIGTFLELSNGFVCVVKDCDNPMRPIVQNIYTGDIFDLHRDQTMLNVTIARTLPSHAMAI